MNKERYPLIYHVMILLFFSTNAHAFEIYSNNPGARAAGFGGLFSAQADDSSTIFYNPAGMSQAGMALRDFSIEYGDTVVGDDQYRNASSDRSIKSLAYYSHYFPFKLKPSANQAWGIMYFKPYRLKIYIPTRRNLVDLRPFGEVTAKYQQISIAYSREIYTDYFFGISFDALQTKISCLEFTPCESNGPYGGGFSIGLIYDIYQSPQYQLKIGSVWRTQARLDYNSTPPPGLGRELAKFIPDRPVSGNIAFHSKMFLTRGLLNLNLVLEQIQWNQASSSKLGSNGNGISDYYKIGVSTELVIPSRNNNIFSLRFAFSQLHADEKYRSPTADIFSAGLGYSLSKNRFIDLGIEQRTISGDVNKLDNVLSFSYSEQR